MSSSPRSTFSQTNRDQILGQMTAQTFDLVIIGGGITGAGAARDAASRGLRVALIEAQDFAEGTSSRSSKLIHGGIRYLENLEFGLVFEALSERRLLFELAPHLVHPLRFVLPLYRGGRVGMLKMGLGMWLYDALSMFEAPELHERLNAHETVARLPLLKGESLLGSYVYSDAYMDDARLVIETLRSAFALGALCMNHVAADGAEMADGKIHAVYCTDRITGQRLRLRARHVISTVGPWTDILAPRLVGEWRPMMRPTKGVHLTFDRERLQLHQAVVMAADHEKRIVFGIPRNEMTIIGTTDTDYSGDPGDVTTTKADVDYLLAVANEYFPGAKLGLSDVIASYAGVRPLVDDGAETESKTSREHVIHRDPQNVTFVAGGKYTTYRLMAEQTVETALQAFSIEDQVRFGRSATKQPLNQLATLDKIEQCLREVRAWSREFRLSEAAVTQLILRHGEEAHLMLSAAAQLPSPLGEGASDRMWAIEARHAARHTMCRNLVDFFMRRTPLFLSRPDHGLIHIAQLSRVFASELGWSDERRHQETAALQAAMRYELAWRQRLTP